MNLEHIKLSDILFLDIETVPEVEEYSMLTEEKQSLWEAKTKYRREEGVSAESFYTKAGIWAEFGKIVCLSVGYFAEATDKRQFRIKSFYGEEKSLLRDFNDLLKNYFDQPEQLLCAHNGKEFDFPFIARRMVIHQEELPSKLRLFGKKPWQVPHLDTLELWKFGDYKHYTSLKLLTNILGVPSPKDDISGADVRRVYYEERAFERITTYCEKDVVAVAQIFLRFRREPLLVKTEIVKVN